MKDSLKRQADFDLVFSKGKKRVSSTLLMLYIKSTELKVGYCVTKKHGKAHLRNYIKRVLRSAFSTYKKQVGNYFIVFLPKKAEKYDFHKIQSDIKYMLEKEKLFNESLTN